MDYHFIPALLPFFIHFHKTDLMFYMGTLSKENRGEWEKVKVNGRDGKLAKPAYFHIIL